MTERPVVPSGEPGPSIELSAHGSQAPHTGISRDEVERLLDLISDLRTDMASDLSLAAAALDADAPAVASDVLAGGHSHLTAARRRALENASPLPVDLRSGGPSGSQVASLVGAERNPGRVRRLARAAGLGLAAPALAVTAAAAAVVAPPAVPAQPLPRASAVGREAGAVADAAHSIQALAATAARAPGNSADVTRAANAVQASLAPLLAAAQTDPQSARQAVTLLLMEQDVLMASRPVGAGRLLRETQRLLHRLRSLTPGLVVPTPPEQPLPSSTPSPDQHRATPEPSSSPSTSPGPSGSPSPRPSGSPRPTSTPTPSPRPSGSPSPNPGPTPPPLPSV